MKEPHVSPGPWEKFKSFCTRHCRGCDEPACRRRCRCCNEPCCRRIRKRKGRWAILSQTGRRQEPEALAGRNGGQERFHQSPKGKNSALLKTDSLKRTGELRSPVGASLSVVKEYTVNDSPSRVPLRTKCFYETDTLLSQRNEHRCHDCHPFAVGVLRASYPAPSKKYGSLVVPPGSASDKRMAAGNSTPVSGTRYRAPGDITRELVQSFYDLECETKTESSNQRPKTVRVKAKPREESSKRKSPEAVVGQMETLGEMPVVPATEPLITLSTPSRGVNKSLEHPPDPPVPCKDLDTETASASRRRRRDKHSKTAANRTDLTSRRNHSAQLVKRRSTASYDLGESENQGNSTKADL
ncbi:unnamed protein product [Schistocephalus solidus]|uniref:CXXC-type domain-containing protein n=1 Tax=Schistocephalus solidus TaxID=70667 RepID=A0A183SU61_SCHSO|nr:unnamed protein product [Schistocephalus solidus]